MDAGLIEAVRVSLANRHEICLLREEYYPGSLEERLCRTPADTIVHRLLKAGWTLADVRRASDRELAEAYFSSADWPEPPKRSPVPPASKEINLNQTEQDICEAITQLWADGKEWPTTEQVAKAVGLSFNTVRPAIGAMGRHCILEKGPNGQGWRVRT